MIQKRNVYLDYLRAVSALMVMLYHYTQRYDDIFGHAESYPVVFSHGCDAVLIFFLLSGYFGIKCINKQKPFDYAVKRFSKLYPVFAVSLIITMVLTTFFLPQRAVSFKDMLLNFTMIPSIFKAGYVDGVYWTLLCELAFYFIVFIICLLHWQKHTDKLLILASAIEITICFLPDNGMLLHIKNFDTKLYLHCFIAGGIIAVLENYVNSHKTVKLTKRERCKTVLLILSLGADVLIQFMRHGRFTGFFFAGSIILIVVLVILYEKGIAPDKTVSKILYPLEFISLISYPLYLFHQNTGYIIIYNLESIGLTNELFIIVPVITSIFAAYLLNRFVEIPANNFIKKSFKKQQTIDNKEK